MVVPLLIWVYTTLDLNLCKRKYDCHGIAFEVENRLYLAHIRLAELQTTHSTWSRASVCHQKLHSFVELGLDCVCQDVFGRAASSTERFWSESEGHNLEAPGWWRIGFALPPHSAWGTDRNTAFSLHLSKWVLSSSRAVGKLKGDCKVFKRIRKEQIVVNCFVCSIHSIWQKMGSSCSCSS